MAELAAVRVDVIVKTKGMWRVVLLGWAIRLFRLKQQHVHIGRPAVSSAKGT